LSDGIHDRPIRQSRLSALRSLKDAFRDGDTIVVDVDGGQVVFKRAEVASPTA